MGEFDSGIGLPAAEGGEELLEMELLAAVGDVDDFVGDAVAASAFHAELERGEIGGCVVECAVAFLDEGGAAFEVGNVVEEDGDGAFALAGQAALFEVFDDGFEAGVVMALAEGVIEGDAEAGIDAVELILGKGDHAPPEAEVFVVAVLEFDEFVAGGFENRGVLFAGGVDEFVEALHFGDGIAREGGFD